MVTYKKARLGFKFVLTERGLEDSRIRAKYSETYSNRQQYEKSVPSSWVERELVKEVPR